MVLKFWEVSPYGHLSRHVQWVALGVTIVDKLNIVMTMIVLIPPIPALLSRNVNRLLMNQH